VPDSEFVDRALLPGAAEAEGVRVPVEPTAFREALSQWASGVAIVTSRVGDRVHGMTVSAFCSVSLEPPLVLVCADKASDTQALIAEAGIFAVNILATGQDALSNRFASKKDEHRRFEGLATHRGVTGAPLLDECVISLDCEVEASHEAGDHVIYVGRVEALSEAAKDEPLLYHRHRYRSVG
jgi:flavin reductase (DIM6/NTAB) family NADH-FMN oxidoreductase RutF